MELYHRLLSIPLYPALTAEGSARVAEAVVDVATKFRRPRFGGYSGRAAEFVLNRPTLIGAAAELHYGPLFRQNIENRRILITGAAGSIGRRLCQCVLGFQPRQLIGLDRSENGMFQLEAELRRSFQGKAWEISIGDVCNEASVRAVIERFGIDTIVHAAAYKHVPLMELHPIEAIRNNVLGTWTVAKIAAAKQVRSHLLISTDKAANPGGIMGKTKRISEQIITALSAEDPSRSLSSIRLGNVFGSDGSVSSTLMGQLGEGLPVTITHPDIQRYFITPEETVHYILRALLLKGRGEILVPEMGEPIRVLELAQGLAHSQGRKLDLQKDIAIVGLRPGEKISEELKSVAADFLPTEDDAIRAVREPAPSWAEMERWIELFENSVALHNLSEAVGLLEGLVSIGPSVFKSSLNGGPADW
jgi:FlaA1/EpsC-like NDP-sugar epimerase